MGGGGRRWERWEAQHRVWPAAKCIAVRGIAGRAISLGSRTQHMFHQVGIVVTCQDRAVTHGCKLTSEAE